MTEPGPPNMSRQPITWTRPLGGEEGGSDSTPATADRMNFVRFVKRKFHILHRGLTEFPTIDWWIIMAVTKTILDLFE